MRYLAALVLVFAATAAHADMYAYRTPDGKLVLSNRLPAGVVVDIVRRQGETHQPLASGTALDAAAAARPALPDPQPALSYVDHNPLAIVGHDVQSSGVWWRKLVTTWLENRSGRTTATGVTVNTACYDETGALIDTVTDYLDAIVPRGTRAARGTLVILAEERPGRIRCESSASWQNAR